MDLVSWREADRRSCRSSLDFPFCFLQSPVPDLWVPCRCGSSPQTPLFGELHPTQDLGCSSSFHGFCILASYSQSLWSESLWLPWMELLPATSLNQTLINCLKATLEREVLPNTGGSSWFVAFGPIPLVFHPALLPQSCLFFPAQNLSGKKNPSALCPA